MTQIKLSKAKFSLKSIRKRVKRDTKSLIRHTGSDLRPLSIDNMSMFRQNPLLPVNTELRNKAVMKNVKFDLPAR